MTYGASQYSERLMTYASQNLNFSLYYDKLYKKEYLPSRIRYNQFFFYAGLIVAMRYLMQPMFAQKTGNGNDLNSYKYYTGDRAAVNIFARQFNKSAVDSHVAKQTFIL